MNHTRKPTSAPARAYLTRQEARAHDGQRIYKVTGTTYERRATRYVVSSPGDLDGIKAEFFRDTGLPPDAALNFLEVK